MGGKVYTLRVLPTYSSDLNQAVLYIRDTLHNRTAAENFIDATERAIKKRLDSDPSAYEPYPSIKKRKYAYYRIFVGNYTIFYVIIGQVMEVRRLIYSRRNIDSVL
jgi:hypothetical protein